MSAIVTPDILARFVVTTLTFEDLANHDGEELGAASNPYAVIGLTIKAVVKTNANVNSSSRGVALKSTRFPPETSLSQIELRFAKPQGGFGFFHSASRAASLREADCMPKPNSLAGWCRRSNLRRRQRSTSWATCS